MKTLEESLADLARGRWVVIWRDAATWHESYFGDEESARAYATKHHGVVKRLEVVE
ncbi:MAG: hypothetical protein RJA36_1867 [Pseudomonadota bacterium]